MDLAVASGLLRSAFEQARRADTSCSESWYSLADRTVRLRIVGRSLARAISSPFSHLELHDTAGKSPDLTVDLWDAEESAIPCPLGARPRDAGESGVVTSSSDGRLVAHERDHSFVVLDRRAPHLVGCVVSVRHFLVVERARPLTLPLAVWCGDRDVQFVHAALVARERCGVLLAGAGGAGKSTAALACATAGFDFLGDDCVGLHLLADGTFQGYSLYSSVTFTREHLARFDLLRVAPADDTSDPNDKAVIGLAGVVTLRLERAAPIRVLALPRIVDTRQPAVRRARKSDALLTLAPSSLVRRAVPVRACLSRMACLVDRVPAYWLELGRDLAAIPQSVDALLSEALRA